MDKEFRQRWLAELGETDWDTFRHALRYGYIDVGIDVTIYYDIYENLNVVAPSEDHGFYIDVFETKAEAEEFAKKMGFVAWDAEEKIE